MTTLTDGAIKAAIKCAIRTQKERVLSDGEGRGVGRLTLILKPMPARITACWTAQQWRNHRRIRAKIGEYPSMPLAEAREVFTRDFADVIQRGGSIKNVGDSRPGTVKDLFAAYVDSLKTARKSSWQNVEYVLGKLAPVLGPDRPARDVTADDVIDAIRPVYKRGRRSFADQMRATVRAAFSWGLKAEQDYRSSSPRRFRLVINPAAGIPTETKVVGHRWLNEDEFARLYRWLECPDTPVHPSYTRAMRVLMLTGQRVGEIACLHKKQWDARERIIDWSRTKNGKAHAIPVPALAAELLESIVPNRFGWFFPSAGDPSKPVQASTLYSFIWRQRDRGVIPVVTNRDLRRTWKTLAGKAGVSKEIRDRLQNHTLQDVSSRSYDRWNYMPEKRDGMQTWNAWVTTLLAKHTARKAA